MGSTERIRGFLHDAWIRELSGWGFEILRGDENKISRG